MKKMLISLLVLITMFSMTATVSADEVVYSERQLLIADASRYTRDNSPSYELYAFLKYATDNKVFYDWVQLDESGFNCKVEDNEYYFSIAETEKIVNYFLDDYYFAISGMSIIGEIPYVLINKTDNTIVCNPVIKHKNFYIHTSELETSFGLQFLPKGNNLIIRKTGKVLSIE